MDKMIDESRRSHGDRNNTSLDDNGERLQSRLNVGAVHHVSVVERHFDERLVSGEVVTELLEEGQAFAWPWELAHELSFQHEEGAERRVPSSSGWAGIASTDVGRRVVLSKVRPVVCHGQGAPPYLGRPSLV